MPLKVVNSQVERALLRPLAWDQLNGPSLRYPKTRAGAPIPLCQVAPLRSGEARRAACVGVSILVCQWRLLSPRGRPTGRLEACPTLIGTVSHILTSEFKLIDPLFSLGLQTRPAESR